MPASQTGHRPAGAEPRAVFQCLQPDGGETGKESAELWRAVTPENPIELEWRGGGVAELHVHHHGPLCVGPARGGQPQGKRRQRGGETDTGHDSSAITTQSETVHELALWGRGNARKYRGGTVEAS